MAMKTMLSPTQRRVLDYFARVRDTYNQQWVAKAAVELELELSREEVKAVLTSLEEKKFIKTMSPEQKRELQSEAYYLVDSDGLTGNFYALT